MQSLNLSATDDISNDGAVPSGVASTSVSQTLSDSPEPDDAPRSPPPGSDLEAAFRSDALALRARYLLEEVIGIGADSIVYKAHDARSEKNGHRSASVIAIKTLRPEVRESAAALARLKREFRQGAALNHSNLVRVHELANASGIWFIAMEWLEGRSLATLLYELQPHGLPPARALTILRACNGALTAAHRRGIAHGDFRPGNVWLSPSDDVHVLGLGLEQKRQSAANGETGDETTLPYVATPSYASPEILAGKSPDPRDDVFSFACVAYELFSGQHPFGRLNAAEMQASRTRIERPNGLSRRRWHALKSGMQWDRVNRTASVQSLFSQLEGASTFAIASRAAWFETRNRSRRTLQSMERVIFSALAIQARRTGSWMAARIRAVAALSLDAWRASHPIERVARLLTELAGFIGPKLEKSALKLRRASAAAPRLFQSVSLISHDCERAAARAWSRRHSLGIARSIGSRSISAVLAVAAQCQQWIRERWLGIRPRPLSSMRLPFIAWLDYRLDSASATALILMGFTILVSNSALRESTDLSPSSDAALHALLPSDASASLFDESLIHPALHIDRSVSGLWQLNARSTDRVAGNASIFESDPQFRSIIYAQRKANRPAQPRSIIALEHAHVEVSDQAVAAVLMLRRSGSTREPAVVRWRTIKGSAKPGADYQEVSSGTARFVDNQGLRAIYVPLVPNRLAQGHRTFEVELTRASDGATLGATRRVMVTIRGRG